MSSLMNMDELTQKITFHNMIEEIEIEEEEEVGTIRLNNRLL